MLDSICERFAEGENELFEFSAANVELSGECGDVPAHVPAEARFRGNPHVQIAGTVAHIGTLPPPARSPNPQVINLDKKPLVYLLECADGSLYTGWTDDLAARIKAHGAGRASKYTRSRRPVRLVAWAFARDAAHARSIEARFKLLSRAEKLRALARSQAFGVLMRKAPVSAPSQVTSGGFMEHTAPAGDELKTIAERANDSQARISTPKGDIVFTFYAREAPQHSAAFVKLADAGFYDGLKFHRVEPGFVIQGGDPAGNGTGGPGYNLKAEFNERPHVRGTVAMARASNPDSAGSQFYICLDDARFLDRQYTVFGQMIDGFDALDAIRMGDVMTKVTIEPKSSAPVPATRP